MADIPDTAGTPGARQAARGDTWSRYWSHGATHSFAGSYGSRYGGALARFWSAAFGALPEGARVLDVATGNGALPQLLLDSGNAALSCDAIDLASIAPPWLAALAPQQRERIRFHGRVAAEALPFADGSFEMVASQYGLEYTDLARSVPELLRVLAPGGKLRLVTHHADSRPVRLARAELGHLAWLGEAHGLLDTCVAMIEPMARAATEAGRASLATDAHANALRARFNELQAQLDLRAQGECPDVLMEVRHAAGAMFGTAMGQGSEAARRAMQGLRQELDDSALRLRELCDYALDEPRARALAAALAGGAAYVLEPVMEDSMLMGWAISVDR